MNIEPQNNACPAVAAVAELAEASLLKGMLNVDIKGTICGLPVAYFIFLIISILFLTSGVDAIKSGLPSLSRRTGYFDLLTASYRTIISSAKIQVVSPAPGCHAGHTPPLVAFMRI